MKENTQYDTDIANQEASQFEEEKEQPTRSYSTALALIPQGPAFVEPIKGMQIDTHADFDAKVNAVATVDELLGSDSINIGKYLNTVIWAVGVVQHDAQVRNNDGSLEDKVRTVLHVCATLGREHEPIAISFVGMAVANYFSSRIIPLFGIRFERPLPFRVIEVPTKKGHTHNVRLVKGAVYPNAH